MYRSYLLDNERLDLRLQTVECELAGHRSGDSDVERATPPLSILKPATVAFSARSAYERVVVGRTKSPEVDAGSREASAEPYFYSISDCQFSPQFGEWMRETGARK